MAPSPRFCLRNPDVVSIAHRRSYLFVRLDRDPVVVSPVDVEQMTRLLREAALPIEASRLRRFVSRPALALLVEKEILLEGDEGALRAQLPPETVAEVDRPCRHLVVGISGAVAALYAVPMILSLHVFFCQRLDVVLTRAATRFINPNAFGFFGIQAWTDPYETRNGVGVPHMHLASAELVLIMPAAAHTLHRLAHGACSDLLSLVVAATRAPVVLAPSMNRAMWDDPPIQRNVARLRADGMYVIEPSAGYQASERQHATLDYGAMGMRSPGLAPTLMAVLAAHKQGKLNRRPATPARFRGIP